MARQTVVTGGCGTTADDGRYRTLDMLRGVAAVIIVLYHEANAYRFGTWFPGFSFLAVDLFFCLSGFVIAKNNDGRFARGLTAKQFMSRRIQRLAPLFLLGWVLALSTLLIPGTGGGAPVSSLATTLALNFLLLPGTLPVLFPLNPPSWSLFLELWVANLLYALLWRWLRPLKLAALVFIATAGLLVAARLYHGADIGHDHASAPGGAARAIFSYFAGVALARFHARRPARIQVPAVWLCAALVALVSLPISGRPATVYQLFCITLAFPALIYWGASAKERRPAIGVALGDASYAAYAIHWPLLGFAAWGLRMGVISAGAGLALQFAVAAAIVGVSFGVHHAFDMPIRSRVRRSTTARG